MAEIVVSVAEKLRHSLMESVFRPINYTTHYRENIYSLTKQIQKLADIKAWVKQAVDTARNNGEEIESDVVRWLIRADESLRLIKEFLEEGQSRSKAWFHLRERYLQSRKAKKIEFEVVKLIERGKFEGLLSGNSLHLVHEYYCLTDSNSAVIKDIKAALKDENVERIGFFGMEGVGKTRLVQNICMQLEEEGLFDKVAWAIVGYKPEYERMRAQIGEKLELELEGRGDLLYRRLTVDDDVLIVLDDVWIPIDLYDLGIPPIHRCKIILISRDRSVLDVMDCEKILEVKDFGSSDDVWKLFWSAVRDDTVDSILLNPLVKQVAYKCGGLPIAILTVARALRGKFDNSIWESALVQLVAVTDNPPLGLGILKKTYSSLWLSFNLLESEEAKLIFLLCSLFPQYSNIPMDNLIYYVLGLRLFRAAGTLMEVRNQVYTLVGYLKASNLLKDGAGHECVQMHSDARHAALHISSATDFSIFSQADSDLVPLPESYLYGSSAISLSLKSIDHFPLGPQCPNPKLLAMDCSSRYFSSSSRMPTGFFYRLKALNVLHLIEMRELSLPPSIRVLENLRTLLIECCTLKHNDHLSILGTLKNLEILSFYGSDIQVLPVEIGQLTGLRMLKLSNCDKLTRISPHVISRLSKLEGLYMNNFAKWEIDKDGKERNNLSIGELASLTLLSELEIHIPNSKYLPNDRSLIFKALHRFDISIGSLSANIQGYYSSTKTFKFSGNHVSDGVIVLLKIAEAIYLNELSSYFGEVVNVSDEDDFLNCRYLKVCNCVGVESFINSRKSLIPKNVLRDHGRFCNMESLQVIDCDRLEFLFILSTARCLVQLKELKIKRCNKIENIVRCESIEETIVNAVVFPKLRSLVLDFLPSLVCFSSKHSASGVSSETPHLFDDMVAFPCLEVLSIYGLDQVELLCDNQISIECFPKLRSITVVNHTKIPRIENWNPGNIFRNLEQLTFMTTPHVSAYLEYYGLRGLRALTLWGHPKLMRRWINMDSFIPKFRTNNLRDLQLWNCSTLRYAISSSTAKLFPQLKTLRIVSCNSMVQVIADNLNDSVSLPPLKCLILQHLPNLTGFSTKNFIISKMISSVCLETLILVDCPLMKTFTVEISTTIQGLGGSETDEDKQIHIPLVPFFDDQVDFPCLVTLKLSDMDGIKKIWNSNQISTKNIICNRIPTESFCLLRELVVQRCSNLREVFSYDYWCSIKFLCLEELIVEDCPLVREVFDLRGLIFSERYMPLGKVKRLSLIKLPSLMLFCKVDLDTPKTGESNSLGSLFSCSVVRFLVQLEVLEVVECTKVEEIIAWEDNLNSDSNFSQVQSIKLKNLPNLVRFCGGNQSLRWSSLTTLEVERCPNLEMLASGFLNSPEMVVDNGTQQSTVLSASTQDFIQQEFVISTLSLQHLVNLKDIWKDHRRILVFSRLSCLTIHGCERLKTLFSPTIVGGLSQLGDLIVDSCKMIEEIISGERSGRTAATKRITLPQLKTIKLMHLPNLVSFLSGEYMLVLPLLDHVRVEECLQMHTFSPGKIVAPNLNEVHIGDSQWEWKGDLESTVGHLFKGEVQYSETKELHVIGPDKLTEILDTKLHYKAFRQLKLLHVENCDEELTDFLSKLLFRFEVLAKLHVENCFSLEQLLNLGGPDFEDRDKIFTALEELKLLNLPKLIYIWNKEIGGYVSLKNLKRVNIRRCGRLVNLFSPSIARDLQQLKELKICDCDMMEEVVTAKTEEGNDEFQEICLPQLQHLELIGLSNLMTFHSGNYAFEWPCLHTLTIEGCPRLKSLTPAFIRSPKSIDLYGKFEETPRNKMVGFPQLNQLYLKSLNDFEEIWQENVTEESFTELQVLEVEDCGKLLKVIPHDMLPRLKKLEKLTIKKCQSLRKVFDLESRTINVKRVGSDVFTQLNEPMSTTLVDLVPDELIEVFGNLRVLKLNDCYHLNNLFLTSIARSFMEFQGQQHPTGLQTIEEPSMSGKQSIKMDHKLLPKLNFLDLDLCSLTLDKCLELETLFSEIHCTDDLPAPRQPLFEQVTSFERLEELHLINLGYFEQIWLDELPIQSLHKLRVLCVENGKKLLKIVPSNTLVNLLELEKLYVRHCDSLKHIFDLNGIMESITAQLFPQLSVLVLTHLPEMVGIFSKKPTGIPVFQNLRCLRIIHCNSLCSLFSTSVARGLQQLQEFKVFGCNKMQVVIAEDEKDAREHIIFPHLRCLVLKHLPQLISFYRGENTIKWPILDEFRIKSVPIMETFAHGSQETPQLKAIYVTFLEKCWKGDLNETIKFLHKNNKKRNTTTEPGSS